MLRLVRLIKPFAGYILVATTIFILVMSSVPSIPTLKIKAGESTIRLDYLIHFCIYGFLSTISFLKFSDSEFRLPGKKTLILILCLAAFAFVDEYHQKFIPGRAYNIIDFVSNVSGIAGGLVFIVIVSGMVRRKENPS